MTTYTCFDDGGERVEYTAATPEAAAQRYAADAARLGTPHAGIITVERDGKAVAWIEVDLYDVMRVWRDGESMRPHHMAGPFATLDEALDAEERHGGYVRRTDGAVLMPDGTWA